MKKSLIKKLATDQAKIDKEKLLSTKRSKFLPTDTINVDSKGVGRSRMQTRVAKYFVAFRDRDQATMKSLDAEAAKDYETNPKVFNELNTKVMGATDLSANVVTGSPTVPDEYNSLLIEKLQTIPTIANQVKREPMAGLVQDIPVENASPTLSIIRENANFPKSDGSYTTLQLTAYKVGAYVEITNELLDFSRVTPSVGDKLVSQLAYSVAYGTDRYLITGTGVNQPTGIQSRISTLKQVRNADTLNTISSDSLIDLPFQVNSNYRSQPSAGYIMSDEALNIVRKLKDSTNRYLWSDNNQGLNNPLNQGTLNGYPVYINNDISKTLSPTAITASKGSAIFFGDLNYLILGIPIGYENWQLDVSEHIGFRNDLTTFRLKSFRATNVALDEAFAIASYRATA